MAKTGVLVKTGDTVGCLALMAWTFRQWLALLAAPPNTNPKPKDCALYQPLDFQKFSDSCFCQVILTAAQFTGQIFHFRPEATDLLTGKIELVTVFGGQSGGIGQGAIPIGEGVAQRAQLAVLGLQLGH